VEVQQAVDYMELLVKVQELRYVYCMFKLSIKDILPFRVESEKAAVEYKNLDYNIIHNGYMRKEITNVRTCNRTTFTRWQAKEEELTHFEEEHSIEVRYLTQTLTRRRKYCLLNGLTNELSTIWNGLSFRGSSS
jgi:hypothetical protein